MTNQRHITDLIKSLAGQANIIAVPRTFIRLMEGDLSAAVLLSQILYWSDRSKRSDGWFYKTYKEWEEETGLSQYQVQRISDKLKSDGILATTLKRANGAPTLHYRLDFDTLTTTIIDFLDNQNFDNGLNKIQQSDYEETQQSDYQETSQSLTDTTAKITTETTWGSAAARSQFGDHMPQLCERLYQLVTGQMSVPSGVRDQAFPDLETILDHYQQDPAKAAPIGKQVFARWCSTTGKSGRRYSTTNPGWLTWWLEELAPRPLDREQDPGKMNDADYLAYKLAQAKELGIT